jgi:predicted flavoprotein YhiN
MKTQSNSLRFTPSPDVVSSVHENGIVLLHICSGQMFASNGTGARIWSALKERQSTETIVSEISTDYQIDRVTARSHVERFLIELDRQNLIQREM